MQLMPPPLDQMDLLCSTFSGPNICGGAWQDFTSPKMKSDISPALSMCTAHPCIPDMVNYSSVNKGLTLHKIYPTLHHENNRLKKCTNRKETPVILPPSESISIPRQTAKGECHTYILLPHTALPSFGWRASLQLMMPWCCNYSLGLSSSLSLPLSTTPLYIPFSFLRTEERELSPDTE